MIDIATGWLEKLSAYAAILRRFFSETPSDGSILTTLKLPFVKVQKKKKTILYGFDNNSR